ncbi:MAG: secondary thiamine-phosphate synthase enzyme YjbQ [Verrucomicrobia bacterium]|nr:secondary thiamine-phosphate synthase enzyme YjbQ [Verrucomicrobiota bacterium]MCF7707930.1 secondary thiamine-phosphate synthase enzyme YjbQ [Verrucomicrobiota bacterium]
MLEQVIKNISLRTSKRGFYEITPKLEQLVGETGIERGLVTALVRHTSASLVIQENADPEVRRDLERFFSRLVPDGDPIFRHTIEGTDDMPAHVRSALTSPQVSIPVSGGRLALGTWQGVYVYEHRTDGQYRNIVVHILGEQDGDK